LTLKIKTNKQKTKQKKPAILQKKKSLFKNRELQFGAIKLWQTICKSREQRRESCFYGGKKEVGRGYFEEFWMMMASHWLSVAVSHWQSCCLARRNSSFLLLD